MRAILFDLGNVLVRFRERKDVLHDIVESFHGAFADLENLFTENKEAAYQDLDTGRLKHPELWHTVCKVGHVHEELLTYEMFSALYVGHLHPIEEMIAVARKLQNRYRLVVISNGDFGSWYALEVLRTFHKLDLPLAFISSVVGMVKPALIAHAKSTLALSNAIFPHECLFVDDVQSYVDEAKKLGLWAMQHNASVEPVSDFILKLKDFNIVV